ncbi:MAG: sugar phosphate nucleotidyltransferase [Chloroflexota bacterium]|nr:sugar phosphate nucleotidyltransferase [Chloroflexota bacterium]
MYYAVIMAGGSGSRLWPLSRRTSPKQALKLVGDRTMFQYAVERIEPVFPSERIFVVTSEEQADILSEQVPELPIENFIIETEGRGTAPAIGLTAIHLAHSDSRASMALLTADHFITDTDHFCDALTAAGKVADDGSLVTLGIQPTFASTGFGYIHQGAILGEKRGFDFYAVRDFIEKPDAQTAQQMFRNGEYSWNSGMFIWKVARILEEFERQMPEFYAQLCEVQQSLGTPNYEAVLKRIWPQVAKQTIDYGVMEGARQVVVFPVEIGWTDVGNWNNLFELLPIDENTNVVVGNHIGIDTTGTLIFGKKRLIATIDIDDLIIVDTDDALLVCSRESDQDVRTIVKRLKENQKEYWS